MSVPEATPEWSLSGIDFSVQLATFAAGFHGREWLFDKVAQWVASSERRLLLIEGGPGAGKSALMARLAITRTDVGSVHFCSAEDIRTIRPTVILRSIASKLADALPGYGDALANTVNPTRLSVNVNIRAESVEKVVGVVIQHLHVPRASEELDILLLAPLSVLPRPKRSVLILIDALDEAITFSEDENIVSLLAMAEAFPNWLRFVCTTRPDQRVRGRLRHVDILNLAMEETHVKEDVRIYVENRLVSAETQRPIFTTELTKAVSDKCIIEPNFLYTKLLIDDLLQAPQLYLDRGTGKFLDSVPSNLEGLYLLFLNRLPRTRWEATYQRILGTLCVAQEPLSETQLAKFSNLSLGALRREALPLAQFLKTRTHPDRGALIALFHPSFRRFLTDPEASRSYYCDESEGHANVVGVRLNQRSALRYFDKLDPYLRSYAIYHLCSIDDSQTTRKLLGSFDWLLKKLTDLGISSVTVDFDLSSRLIPECSAIAELLRKVGHILRHDPTQLAGQVIAGLSSSDTTLSKSILKGAGNYDGYPWLKPIGRRAKNEQRAMRQGFRVKGHVESLAISEDGAAAIVGYGQSVTLLDLRSGIEIRSFSVPKSKIEAVAISENGDYFAAAAGSAPIYVWNKDGLVEELAWRTQYTSPIFLTDGLIIADGQNDDPHSPAYKMICRDLCTRVDLPTPIPTVDRGFLAARGGYVFARIDDLAYVWRARDLTELYKFHFNARSAFGARVDITPDGRFVTYIGDSGDIVVYDVKHSTVHCSIQISQPDELGMDKRDLNVTFADGGTLVGLLTFDFDNTLTPPRLMVWDVGTKKLVLNVPAHNGMANYLSGSLAAERIITGSFDGEVKVWEPRNAEATTKDKNGRVISHTERITTLRCGDAWAVSGSDDGVIVFWNLATGKPTASIKAHDGGICSLEIDTSGNLLFSADKEGMIRIWEFWSRKLINEFRLPEKRLIGISVLDKEYLLCFFATGMIGRWSLETNQFCIDHHPRSNPRSITGVQGDAARNRFAFIVSTGGQFRTSDDITFWEVVVWDVGQNDLVGGTGYRGREQSLAPAISPNGADIYVAHDSNIERLEVGHEDRVRVYEHDSEVDLVAVDPTGRFLASTTRVGSLCVWDEKLGKKIAEFGLDVAPTSICLSPKSTTICVGCDNAELLFFQLASYSNGSDRS